MKIIITTILTIFTCISVGAQDLFSNYQFTRIDQQSEYQLHTSLSGSSFYDDAIPGPDPSWDDGLKINMKTRTLISAGLFIPTIASGYLMRGSNSNPNDGFLAVHKLTSVTNLALLDASVLKKRKITSLSWLESTAAILMNVSFVATISTGGLQSIDGNMPGWVNSSHRITPWISMLASGVLIYVLNKK